MGQTHQSHLAYPRRTEAAAWPPADLNLPSGPRDAGPALGEQYAREAAHQPGNFVAEHDAAQLADLLLRDTPDVEQGLSRGLP